MNATFQNGDLVKTSTLGSWLLWSEPGMTAKLPSLQLQAAGSLQCNDVAVVIGTCAVVRNGDLYKYVQVITSRGVMGWINSEKIVRIT